VVGFGNGCDLDKLQVFNDKEWIATDNNPSSRFYGRTDLGLERLPLHLPDRRPGGPV
jgi:hypothetical protein